MAIIYSYPSGTPTTADFLIGTQASSGGGFKTKSFTVGSIVALAQASVALIYVPYTGATTNVNLGIRNLTATSLIKNGGTSGQFLKADGSIDSSAYIVLGSLSASSPLTYNNTTGAFNIPQSGAGGAGYLSSIDWNTFNNKQEALTLTTTGTGAATFVANVLNIPTPPVSTGVTSVTGISPIISSGGTAPAISIPLGTSLVDGYLSAIDRTNFETAYINRITSLTTTGTGAATLANSVLNIPTPSAIGGSGTLNYIAKFTAAGAVGDSNLFDAANQVLIGTTLTGNVSTFGSSKLVVANNIQSGTAPSTIEIRNLQTSIVAGNSMGKLVFSSVSGAPSGGSAPVALSYGAIEALAAGSQSGSGTSGGILRFLAGGAGNTGQTISEAMRINENGAVGINATSINQSAVLEVSSNTKGFLPPRMTTTQKNAIGSPTPGLIVYDTTLQKLCVRVAAAWDSLTPFSTPAVFLPTIVIGLQQWTKENLDVVTYRNGDIIPQAQDNATWAGSTTGAWCYYNNDVSNASSYGKLYNWYAINDPRGLAPQGWHVPTLIELNVLALAFEPKKLMATGNNSGWATLGYPTNDTGFTAFASGYRETSGTMSVTGGNAVFWASDQIGTQGGARWLNNNSPSYSGFSLDQKFGASVRLIRD